MLLVVYAAPLKLYPATPVVSSVACTVIFTSWFVHSNGETVILVICGFFVLHKPYIAVGG